ncbi:MAG: hypothetical protein HY735_38630 [Verrucomicrobia bacterium]|nr:hypothetical protein [Verrucomicrobiota bacterium]
MNIDEAKFILQAYRPGGQDAGDPQFAEALQQVQKDPALAQWFSEEQHLDAAIAAKLGRSLPPPHLRASILAGRKILEPIPWWNRRVVTAVAASAALLFALTALWMRTGQTPSLAAFRKDMGQVLSSHAYALELQTPDVEQIQRWLKTNRGHGDFVLPAGMKGFPGFGCHVRDWNGKRVSMICFRSKGDGIVHLFVINRLDLRNAPPPGPPQFAAAGEWMTASWTQGDKTYVLAGGMDRSAMQRML